MNQAFKSCYVFGEFRLDGAERRLLRAGTPISLPPKILDTLLLLVENAGHLVEKDEFMKQLWPGTFVGEDALARNISILRKTLGESSDSQSFIATAPTRGYRFVAPVQKLSPQQPAASQAILQTAQILAEQTETRLETPQRTTQDNSGAIATTQSQVPQERSGIQERERRGFWSRRATLLALGLAVGSVAGVITFYLLSPAPIPRIIRSEQLTHSGRVDPWGGVVTDGSRIYFIEREGDHWDLMQSSVSGGDSQIVHAPFRSTVVLDVSPDRSNLLIGSFERRGTLMPLWIWPVQGGALKRVGQIEAYDAAWCPDGRQIVYTEDDGIYLFDIDSAKSRRFLSTDGRPGRFAWSPDGRVLRFVLGSFRVESDALWEVHSDGTQVHPLLPGWSNPPREGRGSWSPNGKYFFFFAGRSSEIWSLREHSALPFSRHAQPIHLAAGPLRFSAPVFGKDGQKLFVIGGSGGGELLRYDLKSHQVSALLPGVCGNFLSYSPDGTRVVCGLLSEPAAGRMKLDGSDRLALTPHSLRPAFQFAWSPDGKQVAFEAVTPEGRQRIFLVSAEGGTPKELFPDDRLQDDPAWSPDGKFIAFARSAVPPSSAEAPLSIQVLDLSSNQLSPLTGSVTTRSPAWSPDARFIAAVGDAGRKLMLFDLRLRQWTQLTEGSLIYGLPSWSADGDSIYFQDILGPGESVYRYRLSTRKKELFVSFDELLRGGMQRVVFRGFAPDGALILDVDRNIADVYALDLDLP